MIYPTAYPEIDDLLAYLQAGVASILGDSLAGFYLNGSLVLGSFDPRHSDVDFLIATAEPLTETTVNALATMHREITTSDRPFAVELEGSYIPVKSLRHHSPMDARFPNLERGPDEWLRIKDHHSDWVIQRHIVREFGVALSGPPPAKLIDPVTPADLKQATADVLLSWWIQPAGVESIRRHPGYQIYAVQTMCRALFTLENGTVTSKPAACHWALRIVEPRWRPLVHNAMNWEPEDLGTRMTEDFIHFVFEKSRAVTDA